MTLLWYFSNIFLQLRYWYFDNASHVYNLFGFLGIGTSRRVIWRIQLKFLLLNSIRHGLPYRCQRKGHKVSGVTARCSELAVCAMQQIKYAQHAETLVEPDKCKKIKYNLRNILLLEDVLIYSTSKWYEQIVAYTTMRNYIHFPGNERKVR